MTTGTRAYTVGMVFRSRVMTMATISTNTTKTTAQKPKKMF